MRLLHKSTLYADYGTIVLTNPGTPLFSGEAPLPSEEETKRGFLLASPDYLFHYIVNDLWRVPIAVFRSSTPPSNFDQAERVVRLPIRVGDDSVLLIGGILTEEPEWRRLELPSGDYTLFSMGHNLAAYPTDDQMDLSPEEYAQLTDVERYDFIIVPEQCVGPSVLKGNACLY